MYRNAYDTDVTTWSPQGRLHQTEYGMEAVKLGTCGVGLRSDTHVVLAGFKRSLSKLAGYNSKLMKVDDHVGVTFSGITADAKYLATYMRRQCLGHRYVFGSAHAVGDLVAKIGSMSQLNTQRYTKRPFGCGLIVGGVDSTGPHVFETCPSGNYTEYYSIAICKDIFREKVRAVSNLYVVLKNNYVAVVPVEELIKHAIQALQCSVAQDQELTIDNISVGVVSADSPWKELTPGELSVYVNAVQEPMADESSASAPS